MFGQNVEEFKEKAFETINGGKRPTLIIKCAYQPSHQVCVMKLELAFTVKPYFISFNVDNPLLNYLNHLPKLCSSPANLATPSHHSSWLLCLLDLWIKILFLLSSKIINTLPVSITWINKSFSPVETTGPTSNKYFYVYGNSCILT